MRNGRIAGLVAALALVTAASAEAATAPSIRIVGLIPVKAQGAHFVPGERVKATLRAGRSSTTIVRATRASSAGAFTVVFGTLSDKDRCSGVVSVTALGARGDRATYQLPLLACPTDGYE